MLLQLDERLEGVLLEDSNVKRTEFFNAYKKMRDEKSPSKAIAEFRAFAHSNGIQSRRTEREDSANSVDASTSIIPTAVAWAKSKSSLSGAKYNVVVHVGPSEGEAIGGQHGIS